MKRGGIMEVLDVALAGCRDNMITDKKIVSEMQYDDLKSELMYYLKCYMNVIEKLSKHVEYTEETLKLLQELCSDVKSFLAKVARLDEKQQKMLSECISYHEILEIQERLKEPDSIFKTTFSFFLMEHFLEYYNIVLDVQKQQKKVKKKLLSSYKKISTIIEILEQNEYYHFSKKNREAILSVFKFFDDKDKEYLTQLARRFFELSDLKYEEGQIEKKIEQKKQDEAKRYVLEKKPIQAEVLKSEEKVLDNISEEYVEDVIYEQDKETYWYHLTHLESLEQVSKVLPQHDYSNYREVMKYLLERLDQEIQEYIEMSEAMEDEVIDQQIIFLSNLFEILRQDFKTYYQKEGKQVLVEDLDLKKNHLFFVEKASGVPYFMSDIKRSDFTKERLVAVKKLLLQVENNTYPRDEVHFRKIANNHKINRFFPIYESKECQTRILFTYLGKGNIAILMAFCKKTDNSFSILNSIANRMADCSTRVEELKSQIQNDILDESYLEQQEEFVKQLTK